MRLWLAHLIFLPLAAWALITVLDYRAASNVVLWLVASVVVHDFIVLPLYSAADRAGRLALPGTLINYVRIPAGLSVLLLVVYWSTIRGKGAGTYTRVSGLEWDGYGTRWLLFTAALFAVSAAVYVVRSRTGRQPAL